VNEPTALYFGFHESAGHCLHWPGGMSVYPDQLHGFPWDDGLLDGGLLRNRKVPDEPDGRVHWTCGGRDEFWFAFVWWDRSGDRRGNSTSGFYVRGFPSTERRAAFAYARSIWADVVARQKHPLVLVDLEGRRPLLEEVEHQGRHVYVRTYTDGEAPIRATLLFHRPEDAAECARVLREARRPA